jgi:hypothetical protein
MFLIYWDIFFQASKKIAGANLFGNSRRQGCESSATSSLHDGHGDIAPASTGPRKQFAHKQL